MGPSKISKAIGAVKDQTRIGLVKVSSSNSLSRLEIAVVKATRHDDHPPDEHHVSEILTLTSSRSNALTAPCVAIIARRLARTNNWAVALKSLMLVYRLLAGSVGDHRARLEREIFFFSSTRRGVRLLDMSDFRDSASGKLDAGDYSGFVRSYASYLDERLEFRIQGRRGKKGGGGYGYGRDEEEEEGGRHGGGAPSLMPVREMKNEGVFAKAHQVKQLLERFLGCRPTGAAKHNRVVVVALYPIVKESFELYSDVTEITATLIDRFMQLEPPDMVRVHEIFCRVSKQLDELDAFYEWCKTVRIVRSSECLHVDKIPQKKLDMMDDFIHQKSAMLQNRRAQSAEPKPEPVEKKPIEIEDTCQSPPPPPPPDESFVENEEKKTELKEDKKTKSAQDIGDLLGLSDDGLTVKEQDDKLALALFDGGLAESKTTVAANASWEVFKDSSGDWETALVQSTSHMSNQKPSFTRGFDTMTLDTMYQHGAIMTNFSSPMATGSASSVALGFAGRSAMLALPAPPATCGGSPKDPFAASLGVAPPVYVQMSEMEKKQRLLVEEQIVWQQYTRYGMQGQVGLPNIHQQNTYQCVGGSYGRTW